MVKPNTNFDLDDEIFTSHHPKGVQIIILTIIVIFIQRKHTRNEFTKECVTHFSLAVGNLLSSNTTKRDGVHRHPSGVWLRFCQRHTPHEMKG